MGDKDSTVVHPGRYLHEQLHAHDSAPYLLILNQPITDLALFVRLWRHASIRICADGGANRLYDLFAGEDKSNRACYLPDCVHGDLDSLDSAVRTYYEAHGVKVTHNPDQYSTDFAKALEKFAMMEPSASRKEILVLGTISGRVDQGLGLLHEMLREELKDPQVRFWLFSESSVSFILREGRNAIHGLQSDGMFTENVGIVPIYGPATISTTGFEWDVQTWPTQMGHQVSTSNHVKSDDVRVTTNTPILFTIERNA